MVLIGISNASLYSRIGGVSLVALRESRTASKS